MQQIKVGEYVRTENGVIGKVSKIVIFKKATHKNRYFSEKVIHIENGKVTHNELIAIQKDIVKHSFEPIDLIEYGDFGIMYYNGMIIKKIISKDDLVELKLKNYKLLKVATKEQIENILYEVGD